MMTSAQVVETSVTNTDNSPSQDYTRPDDQTTLLQNAGSLLVLVRVLLNLIQSYEEAAKFVGHTIERAVSSNVFSSKAIKNSNTLPSIANTCLVHIFSNLVSFFVLLQQTTSCSKSNSSV